MDEISLKTATPVDFPTIRGLAHEIWWPTYSTLITDGQIRLMLENIYSDAALHEQLEAGQYFFLAMRRSTPVGFIGFQHKGPPTSITRIEKLYVLPSEQGKGTGKLLVNHAAQRAMAANSSCLELNVNRYNPALAFYWRLGFTIVDTVDTPYYGYLLNDYILQKQL